ncbi:Metabotropic glutamate receptor [Portunus trituberculatus]|uniref:Metabotropic glutamate receptor n=1 Tax=Portunus trituberculatus TaxID=210409 RepID=A0A5B7E6T3_PORTR|nr:Metabotropic glutamate receptor [Portunus trituberculatus]
MVEQLIEKAAGGARGLALFLTLEDTRVLLRAVQRAVVTSRLLRHQLVLLAPSTWGNNKEMLQEFEGDLGGVLVLRDGQRDVRDFIAHYRLLTPEKNTRNPWFTQYWRQVSGTGTKA